MENRFAFIRWGIILPCSQAENIPVSKIPPLIPKGDIYMQDVQHFKGHTALKSLGHDHMCHLNKFFKKSSLAPQELRYTPPFISDAKWGPFSDTAKGEQVCVCVRNNTHFDDSQRHSLFSGFFFSEKWCLMCNINLFFLKSKKNWIITLLYLIRTLFVSKISFPRFLTNPSFFPISHVSVLICFFFAFLHSKIIP